MNIQEADDKAHEADLAFMLGRFDEYWDREGQASKERLEAEYDRIAGADATRGDSEAGG